MKIVVNAFLIVAACVLTWMCWQSIQIPMEFKAEVAKRDAEVIQRLKDIRTLQEQHRDLYQTYCASWADLIKFAKTDSVKICKKQGVLTDEMLSNKLNEKMAWEYVCNPKKYAKEIEKFGLKTTMVTDEQGKVVSWMDNFRRDTVRVNVLDNDSALMARKVWEWIDKIQYVPFAENDTFILNVGTVQTQSGYEMCLFEAKVPFNVYLNGLDESLLENKIAERLERTNSTFDDIKKGEEVGAFKPAEYPGLQVGDASEANNNSGNWE